MFGFGNYYGFGIRGCGCANQCDCSKCGSNCYARCRCEGGDAETCDFACRGRGGDHYRGVDRDTLGFGDVARDTLGFGGVLDSVQNVFSSMTACGILPMAIAFGAGYFAKKARLI